MSLSVSYASSDLLFFIVFFSLHFYSLVPAYSNLDGLLSVSAAQPSVLSDLLQALYAFVRRLSLSLPTSVSAQTALVTALIATFLPAEATQRAALSSAQVSFALGLVTSAVACLDKTSALFQDIDAPAAGLALCVDYSLHSLTAVPLSVFTSGVLGDVGAAQLIALIVNKVGVAWCVLVLPAGPFTIYCYIYTARLALMILFLNSLL